jgi:hypothetical protein
MGGCGNAQGKEFLMDCCQLRSSTYGIIASAPAEVSAPADVEGLAFAIFSVTTNSAARAKAATGLTAFCLRRGTGPATSHAAPGMVNGRFPTIKAAAGLSQRRLSGGSGMRGGFGPARLQDGAGGLMVGEKKPRRAGGQRQG